MFKRPPLVQLRDPLFQDKGLVVYMLRLDLIHPEVNGNKWYKLKYNLEEAKKQNKTTLLTFGGAWSNHLRATASAGKLFGFTTIGIVRGEELHEDSNQSIQQCKKNGMQLHFISREDYRKKDDAGFIAKLNEKFGDFYLIPEGGSNALAVKGTAEITKELEIDFDYICTACGTGGTLAGIVTAIKPWQQALGISVVNAPDYFDRQLKTLLKTDSLPENSVLCHDYHFGAYAKTTPELEQFGNYFNQNFSIRPDPVYNNKLYYGLFDLIRKNYFRENSVIVFLNTGGNL